MTLCSFAGPNFQKPIWWSWTCWIEIIFLSVKVYEHIKSHKKGWGEPLGPWCPYLQKNESGGLKPSFCQFTAKLLKEMWLYFHLQVQIFKSWFGQVGHVESRLYFSQTKFMDIWSHTRKARVNRGVHDAHFYKSMRVVTKICRFTNLQPKLLKEMWLYFYLQVQNFKLS